MFIALSFVGVLSIYFVNRGEKYSFMLESNVSLLQLGKADDVSVVLLPEIVLSSTL